MNRELLESIVDALICLSNGDDNGFEVEIMNLKAELAKPDWGDSAISDPAFLKAQSDANKAIEQINTGNIAKEE